MCKLNTQYTTVHYYPNSSCRSSSRCSSSSCSSSSCSSSNIYQQMMHPGPLDKYWINISIFLLFLFTINRTHTFVPTNTTTSTTSSSFNSIGSSSLGSSSLLCSSYQYHNALYTFTPSQTYDMINLLYTRKLRPFLHYV